MEFDATTLQQAVRSAQTTREVSIRSDAAAALSQAAQRVSPAGRLLLVADENTWAAAGAQVHGVLGATGSTRLPPLVLPAHPRLKPRLELAQQIADHVRECGAMPVAVGSGVINDLVKYAAALAGVPYLCMATAASMDGYAASGAALLENGFKRTLACAPPVGVFADPQVLGRAPARLNAWGYGDLAGKVVAGADWLVADALGVEAVNPGPYALVHDHLEGWLSEPERVAARDPAAVAGLLAGLLVSGFAMQGHGNSRPASGSDHQFSHLWEMENLAVQGEPAAHGACVGVGCVAMLALYEWLLKGPLPAATSTPSGELDADAALEAEVAAALGEGPVSKAALAEMRAKRAIGSRGARVARLHAVWPELRSRLGAMLLPAATMQHRLRAVGGAAHPADLGLTLEAFAADHRRARLIRRRYTLLDLLEDIGCLDQAIAELFAPSGFWGRQSATRISAPSVLVH